MATHATYLGGDSVSTDYATPVEWRRFYAMHSEAGFLDIERRMNAAIRGVAAEQRSCVIDIAQEMPAGPQYFADMVQCTDKGTNVVARMLAQGLERESQGKPYGIITAAANQRKVRDFGVDKHLHQMALKSPDGAHEYELR